MNFLKACGLPGRGGLGTEQPNPTTLVEVKNICGVLIANTIYPAPIMKR
jgi:hypothetical protein